MAHRIIIILFLAFLTSCIGTKKAKETSTIKEKTVTTIKQNDSLKEITVNKEIKDVAIIPVAKSNTNDKKIDSIVDAKVDEILKKLSFSKQSGDSGYKLSYDEIKNLLEIAVTEGETKNVNEKITSENEKTTTDSQYVSEYIKKVKGVPLIWIIIAVIIIFRKTIFRILVLIFPALKFTQVFNWFYPK